MARGWGMAESTELRRPEMSQDVSLSENALSPRQELAVRALLVGESMTSAARIAGVSRRQLHRWACESPEFVAAVRSLQAELRSATRARLLGLTGQSLRVIKSVLTRRDVPQAVKARTALAVLKMVLGTPEPDESTDPREIEVEIARSRRRRELGAMLERHRAPAVGPGRSVVDEMCEGL